MYEILKPEASLFTRAVRCWIAGGLVVFLASFFLSPDQITQKKIFYAFVVTPVILVLLSGECAQLVKDNVFRLLCVSVVYLACTVFWSPDYSPSYLERVSRDAVYIVSIFVAFWYVVSRLRVPAEHIALVICVVSAIAGVVMLVDFYADRGWNFNRVLVPEWKFGNQNRLAKTYGLVCIFGVALVVFFRNPWLKWVAILCAIVALVLIGLTRSTGGAAALLGVLPFYFYRLSGLSFNRKNWMMFGFVLMITLLALYNLQIFHVFLEQGWSKRDVIWPATIQYWLENPLIGSGILQETFIVGTDGERYYHEHNLILALLRQGGAFGAFFIIMVYCSLFIKSFRVNQSAGRLAEAVIAYSMLASMSGGKFPLEQPDDSWFWTWVPLAIALAIVSSKHKVNQDSDTCLAER